MNRIDRLNAVMIHLQSKPRVTLNELEERFSLTRRTLFRDIRALMDAGIPIGGDAGQGYFIVEGYHLPPVVFNKEEASAILLGAKLIEHNADANTSLSFQNALTKVKAVLRYADKEFLDDLEKRITIIPSPSISNQGFPDSHMSEIQYAIASKRTIRMSYYSNYNDTITDREIEPLGMVYYTNRWHLIGFCRLRQGLRDFRTDRIQKLHLTANTFDPSKNPNYLDFLMDMITGTDAKEVTVEFTKEVSRFISDQRYNYGFVEEKVHDKTIEMRFLTPSYRWIARWLLTIGKHAKIIAPAELKETCADLSRESYEHFQLKS